ncbi:MAG: EthD domain-containing protein [Novosphingobium sp.]|nr:EthD domain-containing protein [Novosphingobium sp.]
MFKQVCLLTRRPGMSMEEFIDYYENQHAPLLASMMPQARRYVRRFVQPEGGMAFGDLPQATFDCLMELWWESRESFEASMATLGEGDNFQRIFDDEEKIFASHANPGFSVEEVESQMRGYDASPAYDAPRQCNGREGVLKLVFLLKRKPGMTTEEFRDYYETKHRKLAEQAMPGALRYVRRYVSPEPNPITGEAIELPFDVVMELWWKNRAAWDELQASIADSEIGRAIYADEENLFSSHLNPVFSVLESDSPMRGW